MVKISVVVNTINEEKRLDKALASVKSLADEMVVVDMMSDDNTVKIAKKHGAKVYEHKKTGYVEPARNFALGKASGDWILLLDADERVPKTLTSKLKKLVKESKADYYTIPRKNVVFGKWIKHSRWWPDQNVRFFKKGKVVWGDEIHSVPTTLGVGLDLPVKEKYAIEHHHYTSVTQFIERLNRYTGIQAKQKIKEGDRFTWVDLVQKPAGEFLSRYFKGAGYKDGLHGLVLATLQAFSEFVVYLKIWEAQGFVKKEISLAKLFAEFSKARRDYLYWKADSLFKTKGGIVYRIKRKFKLP